MKNSITHYLTPITHYLIPIIHYLIPITLFLFSLSVFAQTNNRLNIAGNMKTDTIITNSIKKENGTSNQILMADGSTSNINVINNNITNIQTELNGKANLHSPNFTGAPTAPTANQGNNSTQIATTEYVQTGLLNAFTTLGTDVWNLRTDMNTFLDDANARFNTFTTNINASLSGKLDLADTTKSVRLRGDQTIAGNKTFTGTVSGISKNMVGLGNVNNTSDANKPVSTATQTALDLKAPLASPALTGTPTAPTAATGTNTTQVATTAFVQASLGGKLPLSDTTKSVRISGNQTVSGLKTFSDIQLTKSFKWLNPSGSVDWDFVTIDSAVYYSGNPFRNFAIRVKAPIGTGYKQFTFNPNGDFYASGTVYPTGGIYVATGDIYTGRNLTVTGELTANKISTSSAINAAGNIRADTLFANYLYQRSGVGGNTITPIVSNTTLQTGLATKLSASDTTKSVRIWGDQTIKGTKTFNTIQIDNTSTAAIYINSNSNTPFIGMSLQRASAEKWFMGLPEFSTNLVMIPSCPSCGTGSNVGINTSSPTQRLDVSGNIRASGSVIANTTTLTSDRRLKSNIQNLKPNAMATLRELRPVEYDKKDSIASPDAGLHEYGFIAQEVQKILPLLVTAGKDKDQLLHLNYTALIPILTKALQEQDTKIKQQEDKLIQLESLVKDFNTRLQKIEKSN